MTKWHYLFWYKCIQQPIEVVFELLIISAVALTYTERGVPVACAVFSGWLRRSAIRDSISPLRVSGEVEDRQDAGISFLDRGWNVVGAEDQG